MASAADLLEKMRNGELSSVALLEALLARIRDHNPRLNAIVVLDADRARERAAAADAARAAGTPWGPLHGLCLTVKEQNDIAGLPTTHGDPARTHAPPAAATDFLVQHLERAGAIVFGKTNVPISCADVQTYNTLYGTCNNPWNESRTAGGSSGGSAAALAARLTPLELGSDIGGSIRVPAAHCGVFGLKTTFGILPRLGATCDAPHVPSRDLSVRGPMARTAADLELMLTVLTSAPHPHADFWRLQLPRPLPAKTQSLGAYRVAVWPSEPPLAPIGDEVAAAVQRVVGALTAAGAHVDAAARPALDPIVSHKVYLQLLGVAQTAQTPESTRRGWVPLAGTDAQNLWERVESGGPLEQASLTQSAWQHAAADRQRNELRAAWRRFFLEGGWDAVLMPIYPLPAIAHDHLANPALQPGTSDEPYWRPGPRTLDVDGTKIPYCDAVFWAGLATVSYLPALAFPSGRGGTTGLPVGLQLVGPEGADFLLIELARLLETKAKFECEVPPGVN